MKLLKKQVWARWLVKDLLILLATIILITGGLVFFWISTFKIPDLNSFDDRKVSQSTKIYDRTGQILLYDVFNNVRRVSVSYDKISKNIKNATVAIEDNEFYQHHGIKPTAIIRAVLANFTQLFGAKGYSQGGSTITQQVVKNSLLTTEKTISRKIKEWVLSLEIERVLSKEQILALYLNESPYGGSIYGVEEACETYFGKTANDVTIAEAAYIAALPQAPSLYSPYGNNRPKLDARKNLVLSKMLENKFISQDEYNLASKEIVTFKPQEKTGIKAPHFVTYIKQYLEEKYGASVVSERGLKVTTTLDYSLQEKAEKIVKEYALSNKTKFNAENAAMVAIDPKTGQVLVMVGSRDYFDKEIDGNFNVALAHRQPGSTFKPFVYATAFNKGYTPDTVLFDLYFNATAPYSLFR
jgi:membrane peptidoglycan carboxypeptidase